MKIEVGKYYKDANGDKRWQMRGNCSVVFDYLGSVCYFDQSGCSIHGYDPDLISEWVETQPETGTLRELNVQIGDVVENQNNKYRYMVAPDMTVGGNHVNSCIYDYKIISRSSRATPTPVITETVTTQRIVPGVYGEVKVHDPGSKYVRINIDAAMDITALREAIQTLTQIRDALTHNSAK